MLFWIAPAFKLAPYVLGGLDYLRRLLQPPSAPTTSQMSLPPPPVYGGQCPTLYTVRLEFFNGTALQEAVILGDIKGAITGLRFGIFPSNARERWTLISNNGTTFRSITDSPHQSGIIVYANRQDGSSVTCPPPADPNAPPPPSISDDGIPSSNPPNLDSAPIVIEAIPPIALPSFAAALAAALAAARNALDALDAIKAIARAIEALSDLLNKKNEEENKKEKEKKENQDTIRYEFGSIQRDGFLRLYPDSNLVKYVAQQLDISFVTIPPYLGKYFGKFSPNYYRYKPTSNLISSLGYISFVSPTFGILSTHHLEFRRTSIKVPENSIGFYYHLGLDGALTANAFAFYTKPKP